MQHILLSLLFLYDRSRSHMHINRHFALIVSSFFILSYNRVMSRYHVAFESPISIEIKGSFSNKS